MKKKYVIYSTIVTTIALLVMFSFSVIVTKNNNLNQAENEIIRITKTYLQTYDENIDYSKSIDKNVRLTIIDSKGIVISDTYQDATTLENHINREEIIKALNNEPTPCIRKSTTTNQKMIYYAVKVDRGSDYIFIRTSMPVSSVTSYLIETIPSLILILLTSLVVSTVISYFFARRIIVPLQLISSNLNSLNKGKYFNSLPNSTDNDVNEIILEINELGEKLKSNIVEMDENQKKLDFVLNNISNGIVTFDKKENILLMNKAALRIFNLNEYANKTINYLSLDVKFIERISSIIESLKSDYFEYNLNGKFYSFNLTFIEENLFILVINDITNVKNNELIRSEFFANASHELKTPLTSIKGFNEIVMMNNKDISLTKYLEKIEKESNRILVLLDDMLKLSKYENAGIQNNSSINLTKLANEIKDELILLINQKNINIQITGEASIIGEKEHFYEILKNLIENAIKYNLDNGEVRVSLSSNDYQTIIIVSDNGIGIEESDQSRVFERFYRVNKSRSRNTGGTGLGLSIVKHITSLYDGKIELTSALGKGTEIKIIFPNK